MRIRVLETASPLRVTGAVSINSSPPRWQSSLRVCMVPERPLPKQKSGPSTSPWAAKPLTTTRSKNSCAERPSSSAVGAIATAWLAPIVLKASRRSASKVSGAGAGRSGRSTALACGSKVTATTGTSEPNRAAKSRAAASSAACPKCAPSKWPSVTTPWRHSGGKTANGSRTVIMSTF